MKVPKDRKNIGYIDIKTWADDRKAAFSLTFDDGFLCHYEYVRPILNQFGFNGTFYVIIERLIPDITGSLPHAYGSWDQFAQMAGEGHEIGSHSMTHSFFHKLEMGSESQIGTLLFELSESKKQIEQKIPDYTCISFAYPYASTNPLIANATQRYYEAARTVGPLPNYASLSGNEWMNLNSMGLQWAKIRERPEDDLPKLKIFTKWVEEMIITHKAWGIFIFHEVLPFAEIRNTTSWEPTSTEWLNVLCLWLNEKSRIKELWIENVANITKYTKERHHFSYYLASNSDSHIEIDLKTSLNKEIFDYPLTADISIPEDWNSITFQQDENKFSLPSRHQNSINFVRVNINPHNKIKLRKNG